MLATETPTWEHRLELAATQAKGPFHLPELRLAQEFTSAQRRRCTVSDALRWGHPSHEHVPEESGMNGLS
jgi:hypothetical protein